MYIYHAFINALSAPMTHINLNMIFYTHVEHSPTKTIYIKYYKKQNALQTVVSLLQLKLYQTFVLYCHVAYASSNETKIV